MLSNIFSAGLAALAAVIPVSIAASNIVFFPLLALWLLGAQWTFARWPVPPWGRLATAYSIFLVVSLLSALLGGDIHHSLREIYNKDFYFLIALLLVALLREQADRERVARIFINFSLLMAAWGIVQFIVGVNQTDRSHGEFLYLPAWVAGWPRLLLNQLSMLNGRVAGTRSHPLTYAECLLLAYGFCLAFVRLESRRSFRRWIVSSWLIGGALLLSLSRGPWLAAAIMTLLAFLPGWRQGGRWRVAFVCLPILAIVVVAPLRARALSILDTNHHSNSERLHMWHAGRLMWQSRPILGIGPGNVKSASPLYQTDEERGQGPWGHLHSTFVNFAAERGAAGLLSYLFFIALLTGEFIKALYRRNVADWERAVLWASLFGIVGYLLSGVTETTYNASTVSMVFYFVMGLGLAVARY